MNWIDCWQNKPNSGQCVKSELTSYCFRQAFNAFNMPLMLK